MLRVALNTHQLHEEDLELPYLQVSQQSDHRLSQERIYRAKLLKGFLYNYLVNLLIR